MGGEHRQGAGASREGPDLRTGGVHHDRQRDPRADHAREHDGHHLRRLPDLLHAAVHRARLRLDRARARPDVQPRLPADLGHDEGRHPARGAAVHLHGVHERAGGADEPAVRGAAQHPRPGARIALPGGAAHRDDLRDGDRDHRRRGHRARHHCRTDHGQGGLRRAAVGRRDRRRRQPRHPDSAERHAAGDGAPPGCPGQPSLQRRVRSRLPARGALYRLLPCPELLQPETRPAGPGRRADHQSAQAGLRVRRRRGTAGGADRHDLGDHHRRHRHRRPRRRRAAPLARRCWRSPIASSRWRR